VSEPSRLRAYVRRGVLLSVGILASLGFPALAAAGTSDLVMKGSLVESNGGDRTVRFTLTNRGPDAADVRPTVDWSGGFFGMQYSLDGAQVQAESMTCRQPGTDPGVRSCRVGDYLPVGATYTLDTTVRVTGPNPSLWFGTVSQYRQGVFTDPDLSNNGGSLALTAASGCKVEGRSPQKPGTALAVKVVAPAGAGCVAKLKSATLQIGKKTFVFVRRRPQRTLAAGESWSVRLPYGAPVLDVLRKALKRGDKVTATAEFDIDGALRVRKVRIK
jgi:hypothetical protein